MTCSIAECERNVVARGWCKRHYYRWNRTGDPTLTLRPELEATVEERFWSSVDFRGPIPPAPWAPITSGCWLWTGSAWRSGYGRFWDGENRLPAHRVAYAWLTGPIPDGMELDHLCRVKLCVRPDHLEPVTRTTNMRRAVQANPTAWGRTEREKTHCPSGHEYDDANTHVSAKGWRHCRRCGREQKQRSREQERNADY